MKNRRIKRYKICKGCGEMAHRSHRQGCKRPGTTYIQIPPFGQLPGDEQKDTCK